MSAKPPSWRKPAPLGYGPALDAATNIAAPLLAGFSITAIAAVAASSDRFRWPGPVLLSLTVAAVLLVASVQFGFHARQHLYSPADVAAWWTAEDLAHPGRADRLQREQHADYETWQRWSTKARLAYNAGIVILAVGVALALVPSHSIDRFEAAFRWTAAAVAAAAALGELVWSLIPVLRGWLASRQFPRDDTDMQ
jgi:hypothetical protein